MASLPEEEEEEEEALQVTFQEGEEGEGGRIPKRMKMDHSVLRSPPFYFNLHRHSPKGKILSMVR